MDSKNKKHQAVNQVLYELISGLVLIGLLVYLTKQDEASGDLLSAFILSITAVIEVILIHVGLLKFWGRLKNMEE
ncbi:MAG TPA: hypothetical protein DCX54_07390 [Flavobacteriales bacterium]|nr:hypothetical protein [Flavobacteriales bacterium]